MMVSILFSASQIPLFCVHNNQFPMILAKIGHNSSEQQANDLSESIQDPSYSLSLIEAPRQRRNRKKRRIQEQKESWTLKKFNTSKWSIQENLLYVNFLKTNRNLFESSMRQRRLIKVNVLISQAVKTRSSDQCRSHHQKMMKVHKDLSSIIEYFESQTSAKGLQYVQTIDKQNNEHKQEQDLSSEQFNRLNEFKLDYDSNFGFESIGQIIIWYDGFQFDYQ